MELCQRRLWRGFERRGVHRRETASADTSPRRSAKAELDQRNRASILETLNGSQKSGGDSRGTSLALLKQIAGMSDEEKSVMGYTDAFVSRIAQITGR